MKFQALSSLVLIVGEARSAEVVLKGIVSGATSKPPSPESKLGTLVGMETISWQQLSTGKAH